MLNEVNLIDNEDTFKVLQLSSLIVATPYRNQGIGKALVQAVCYQRRNIILYRKMMISSLCEILVGSIK